MNTEQKLTWTEKLEQVRAFGGEELVDIDPIVEEIEALLNSFDEEEVVVEEPVEEEVDLDKLTERNMLGRLAKSLDLDEDNKTKLFNYFEKGELVQ